MSCRAICEMMSDRLDGMASVRQIAEMDAHLDCCVACRRQWELFRLLDSRLEQTAQVLPSPDFSLKVLACLDDARSPARKPSSAWPYFLAALVISSLSSLVGLAWGGISSWPVLSHPALLTKVSGLIAIFISVMSAAGKVVWAAISLVDRQETGIIAVVTGFAALYMVFLWARLVGQWWQLGSEERAL